MLRDCPCSTKTREVLENPSPLPSRFPSTLEISLGLRPREISRVSGNLSAVGDGFPNASLVLVEHGYNPEDLVDFFEAVFNLDFHLNTVWWYFSCYKSSLKMTEAKLTWNWYMLEPQSVCDVNIEASISIFNAPVWTGDFSIPVFLAICGRFLSNSVAWWAHSGMSLHDDLLFKDSRQQWW